MFVFTIFVLAAYINALNSSNNPGDCDRVTGVIWPDVRIDTRLMHRQMQSKMSSAITDWLAEVNIAGLDPRKQAVRMRDILYNYVLRPPVFVCHRPPKKLR